MKGDFYMKESGKYIVFRVNNEEYAIDIDRVIAIERVENISPVPHLPSYVKGITLSRGHLVPVLDIKDIFYHQSLAIEDEVRTLVLQGEGFEYGLLVADTKEIIEISSNQIEKIDLLAHFELSYMAGVANLNARLITVIDTAAFIRTLEGMEEIDSYINELKQEQQAT